MSYSSRPSSPHPRQVVLWRSRVGGARQVRSTSGIGTPTIRQDDDDDGQNGVLSAHEQTLVLGSGSAAGGLDKVRSTSPPIPVLETCPYCFQFIPEDNSASFANYGGSDGSSGVHHHQQQQQQRNNGIFTERDGASEAGSIASDRTFEEINDSGLLAVDPERTQRSTQLLRTQPYFRTLEGTLGTDRHGDKHGSLRGGNAMRPRSDSMTRRVLPDDQDHAQSDLNGSNGYYRK